MVRLVLMSLLGFFAPVYSATAQEARASADQIVARATLPLAFENGVLSGPGAERLIQEAQSAQFVVLIESHNDHVTPLLTADLFRQLNRAHGFDYLAIEQDPSAWKRHRITVAVETCLALPRTAAPIPAAICSTPTRN